MRKKTLALRGTLLAATALLAATPAPALSQHAAGGKWLYLTVAKGGDIRAREIHGRLLMCDPPRGHVGAAKACAELDAARGDVDLIPPRHLLCPMIYDPVTVSARGRWTGRRVDYGHTFANTCDLAARTGSVFDLPDPHKTGPVPGLPR
ncbi:SSI family serine proteinase inhibitor [Streptomyces sp. NPDC047022]|uniref:SSI family serine proteinase inhibitor n=1 Tax=Streptomyces sp. NPDC047022 TaxID=3155737 RepID=UPI0033DD0C5A